MPRKRAPGVWASGDRKTVWSKKLELRHPDGGVEGWTIDRVSVLHPRSQQVARVRSGQLVLMQVFPANRQFYSRETMTPVKYTSYYVFSQYFYGGRGSSRDPLGGFNTGKTYDFYEKEYRRNIAKLRRAGFVEV